MVSFKKFVALLAFMNWCVAIGTVVLKGSFLTSIIIALAVAIAAGFIGGLD